MVTTKGRKARRVGMSSKSVEMTTAEYADASKQVTEGADRGHQSSVGTGKGEATTLPHKKKSGRKKGKKGKKRCTEEGGEGSDETKEKGESISEAQ